MNNTQNYYNPFEISELANFDKNIENIPKDQQMEKRRQYLDQALKKMKYNKNIIKSFGCFLIPFVIIPLFWPMLIFMYFIKKNYMKNLNDNIESACKYWNININDIMADYTITES
jgi:Fe2+ transport system protein B